MTGQWPVLPTATYRLQLAPALGFVQAITVLDHLADLGVSHLYLSPILQASPGSTHGYDVVDHTRVRDELGGATGLRRLADAAHAHGMGLVVDVVPNHMGIPVPETGNHAWWSLLLEGPGSRYDRWFDIDWQAGGGRVVLPILGSPLEQVLAAGELTLGTHDAATVLRYHDHVLPVRPGTEHGGVVDVLGAQHYRLTWWRAAEDELNYRRFFDITSLPALRVEDPDVFEATHRVVLDLVADGVVDGLRIDHVDGLADPRGYLRRLDQHTHGAWMVVEKILAPDEEVPVDWPVAGTTGYETLRLVGGVFCDPAGEQPLLAAYRQATGAPATFIPVARSAKRLVMGTSLRPEVHRLERAVQTAQADAPSSVQAGSRQPSGVVIRALLAAMDRYRTYLVPGEPPDAGQVAVIESAAARAAAELPRAQHRALARLVDQVLGHDGGSTAQRAVVTRFAQTTGPVMAKGVEDTAFYRWAPLLALNEVGGDPGAWGVSTAAFHEACRRTVARAATGMTTLSTHDTKRSEDVRARLQVLSEMPEQWVATLTRWRASAAIRTADHTSDAEQAPSVDPETEDQLWQTLVGAWPIDAERLVAAVTKMVREAKVRTSWSEVDPGYEAAVQRYARTVLADPQLHGEVAELVATLDPYARIISLGQKIVALTMPGVPDTYQGGQAVLRTLMDPDNRSPVDHAAIADRLARLDAGTAPTDLDDEKLLVTSTALRLRRRHPEWFAAAASYHELALTSPHVLAFCRGGQAVTVATRLGARLAAGGGFGEHALVLPAPGSWTNLISGVPVPGARVRLTELLDPLPVALLVRTG
ncbi:MAG: malto-oligosyltrehalose synthase [Actinomycetes bacterium]